jgi:hypothetical protein
MADIKLGEPFGLDPKAIEKIDWELALQRIINDLKTDFIYAPHLNFIYAKAGDQLIDLLKADLRAGSFNPAVPITIEVPKSFRIRVAVQSPRLGPSFSRPGSILLPRDRVIYQALADEAAPIIEAKTDSSRSFSHRLISPPSANMFVPTRVTWNELQQALSKNAASSRYILKVDVANCFGSLNQHMLINLLNDSGYPRPLSSRLEALLIMYTGDRSSRGILQGMYPSDLFGNYYLEPIDRFLADGKFASARYVDHIYVFLESVDAADRLMRELIPVLRSYDLVLNEAKSVIIPATALITEEPDLEALFDDAVAEIADQVDDEDFDADYGFQSEWEEGEVDEEELELEATTILFDSIASYPGHEENIERFCLPLFSKAGSDYAVDHVMDSFKKRPSMSQIYVSYLAKFLDLDGVREFLVGLLSDASLTDWQRMWVLAALSQADGAPDTEVRVVWDLLRDANRHEALRAVAAIFVGRFGDHTRRIGLASIYSSVSNYVQAAIYYSSRQWPGPERANARASWSGHGPLHSLITAAMAAK